LKVLLINPSAENAAKMPVSTAYAHATFVPPLGLLYISSSLRRAGHEVHFIDAMAPGVDVDEIRRQIEDFSPDLIGISAYTFVFYDLLQTARLVKSLRPDTPIVLGGPHIDIYPEETLGHPEFDYLVAGEGEFAIVEICDMLQGNRTPQEIAGLWYRNPDGTARFTGPRERNTDLDSLPFPDVANLRREYYHCAFNPRGYEVAMVTSRGCPFRCRYCNVLDRRYTSRSAENVVAEFRQLADYGFNYAHLYDDTFNLNLDRAKDICRGLIDSKLPIRFSARLRGDRTDREFFRLLALAGCERVNIGVESADENILRSMDKHIDLGKVTRSMAWAREYGIRTVAFFMLGFPGETAEQAQDTIDFALKLNSDYAQFLPVMPFPGTPLFKDALAAGGLSGDFYSDYTRNPTADFHLQLWETEIPLKQLVKLVQQAYRRFYFNHRFLLRQLLELRSYSDFRERAAIGLKLLAYQFGKIWQ
jgi:radical SAM superfamily enzyme YgiQ (UPF0313 family)